MTISTTSLVLLAWLAQSATPVTDSDSKAKAKALLGEGSSLYRRGDYAGALAKFEAAYAAFPSPKLWFNIGQANRDLGRPVEALDAFEKFVGLAPDAPADALADARSSVSVLRKQLGQIRVECAISGAEISLDGKNLGQAPLPGPVWATPGRHQVAATHASASPVIENADVTAGALQTVVVRLVPTAPPATVASTPATASPSALEARTPAPQADRGWWLGRKWTWVAAGSAVLLTGAAAIVGGLAQSRFNDLNSSCGSSNATRPGCDESEISALKTRTTEANVLWGLAGAAAVTAGVLFFVEGHAVEVAPLAGETKGMFAKLEF